MPTRRATHSSSLMPRRLLAHVRLLLCGVAGCTVGFLLPADWTIAARALIGWNVLVWLYLLWVAITLLRADAGHMKRVALAQSESAPIVLLFVVVASLASLGAVIVELTAAKAAGPHAMAPHLALAFVTVLGTWLLLPTLFALTYAAAFYARDPDNGLAFPNAKPKYEPDHTDFLYFSFTIAVTAQTSDVSITTREMRRLVIYQSVLSFVFNTTILAFSINAAASFF